MTGFIFYERHTEVDEVASFVDVMAWINQKHERLRELLFFMFLILFLSIRVLQFLYIHGYSCLSSFSWALHTNFQGSSRKA